MNTFRSSLAVHLGLTAIYFSWLFGCAAKSAEEAQHQAERDDVAATQVAEAPAKPTKLVSAKKKPAPTKPVAQKPVTEPTAEKKPVEKKVTAKPQPRKVIANVVNIRSKPSTNAEIVGKLTRGTSLPVQVEGQWAKLGENQYVLAKFLASNK